MNTLGFQLKDLRTGNIVLARQTKSGPYEPHKLDLHDLAFIWMIEQKGWTENDCDGYYKPLPVDSVQMTHHLGFVESAREYWVKTLPGTAKAFTFCRTGNRPGVHRQGMRAWYGEISLGIHALDSVHQLQNFMWALSGAELEYSLRASFPGCIKERKEPFAIGTVSVGGRVVADYRTGFGPVHPDEG